MHGILARETHSNILGVSTEFRGQVAQRKGAAGAHGRNVHISLHLPILQSHLSIHKTLIHKPAPQRRGMAYMRMLQSAHCDR